MESRFPPAGPRQVPFPSNHPPPFSACLNTELHCWHNLTIVSIIVRSRTIGTIQLTVSAVVTTYRSAVLGQRSLFFISLSAAAAAVGKKRNSLKRASSARIRSTAMFSLKIVQTFLDKSQELYTRRTRQSYTILYIINCLSDSTHGQTIDNLPTRSIIHWRRYIHGFAEGGLPWFPYFRNQLYRISSTSSQQQCRDCVKCSSLGRQTLGSWSIVDRYHIEVLPVCLPILRFSAG